MGTQTNAYEYNSFGEITEMSETYENPFRYCGEYYDAETGWIYLRNRYYNPETGRFINEDPARDGSNWYVYANNNPIMFFDPFGLAPTTKEAAEMADHIYHWDQNNDKKDRMVSGWRLIDVWWGRESMKMGIYIRNSDDWENPSEYVIVFKGTDNLQNWVNNAEAYLSSKSADMWDAINYSKGFVGSHSQEITFVGHSKGGGEAIAAATATNKNAITFNAANFNFSKYGLTETNKSGIKNYYVDGEVQEIADYVGDSYYLAELATTVPQKTIIFCGVSFMGESAKILSPEKTVIMADRSADCPMAHMVEVEKIREVRKEYPDVAVVCYVNSMAEIKAESDVCVTSSNALKIVKKLPNKDIFFIPDENLGRFIAKKVPEKHFIFNDGFCHVHKSIHAEDVKKAKELHPEAVVLAHPECTGDVLELADFVGSTSQIIDYATNSDEKVFLICTEMGVFYELLQKNPEKKFFSVGHRQFCPNMKKIHLDSVLRALENPEEEVEMDEAMRQRAVGPLARMLELAK